jgi:hypothetical protein
MGSSMLRRWVRDLAGAIGATRRAKAADFTALLAPKQEQAHIAWLSIWKIKHTRC